MVTVWSALAPALRRSASQRSPCLTRREWEIAGLAAEGYPAATSQAPRHIGAALDRRPPTRILQPGLPGRVELRPALEPTDRVPGLSRLSNVGQTEAKASKPLLTTDGLRRRIMMYRPGAT